MKIKEESVANDLYFVESKLQGLEVVRLPVMGPKVWYHANTGERHRLRVWPDAQ